MITKEAKKEYDRQRYLENKSQISEKAKKYRQDNKEKINKYHKNYSQINKEKLREKSKTYYIKNKAKVVEYHKKYYKNNLGREKKKSKDYYQKNRQKVIKRTMIYKQNRKKNDVNFKLICCLRTRLYIALKRYKKSKSTMKLIGCTLQDLKQHLENKFKKGMTWKNYGKWHIDHIRPCVSFDLSKPKEQRKCFHYNNLQPLWAEENLRKWAN